MEVIPKSYLKKNIIKLIQKEYRFGYVLDCVGIPFYEYHNDTLKTLCEKKKISPNQIAMWLDLVKNTKTRNLISLEKDIFIMDLLNFLKFSHTHLFRKKLNYLLQIVSNVDESLFSKRLIQRGFKYFLKVFVDKFCEHMREEEEVLFSYITELKRCEQSPAYFTQCFHKLNNYSINHFFKEHLQEDDDMTEIRKITNNYKVSRHTTPHTRLVFMEFLAFEKELKDHSQIENKLLFPKAQALEKQVKQKIQVIANSN